MLFLLFGETPGPPAIDDQQTDRSVRLTIAAMVVLLAAAVRMLILSRRRLAMGTIAALLFIPATLYGCELIARWFVPDWPARGLHGVTSDHLNRSWGRIEAKAPGVGFNHFGQRDRA